jgi:tetratricopeptide (TPR) repeat protein
MDLPPPPTEPPDPPGGPPSDPQGQPRGASALQLTLRVGDRPIGTRVAAREGELVPEAPIAMQVRRSGSGWELTGPDGTRRIGPRETVSLRHGDVEVEVAPVRQFRFARFHWDQGDVVLPVIMVATMVFLLQLGFLLSFFAQPPADGGYEPTPEYIARLLGEQFDGKERGVMARRAPRSGEGEPIEGYFLQSGHKGELDHIGGGANVGERVKDGYADGQEVQPEATVAPEAGTEVVPTLVAEEDLAVEEEADDKELEDKPIAVHVDEGWGLTDWYDTKDAREDAKEIQEQLKAVHDLLRLDPDDPAGLATRAYYEYLAFDMAAARKTYDKYTRLYPEDAAGWNNLALVYKREGEYQKEEELYRIALSLSPEDDHALNNLAVCLAHQGRFDEALVIMEKLEGIIPEDAYADLHRAKIYAAMGKEDRAYRFLQKSLAGMRKLDTLHNIEFRQDIRVDPAFEEMRKQDRFGNMLERYYGEQVEGWWKKKKGR